MYAVTSPDPDPNPRGWGQLPEPVLFYYIPGNEVDETVLMWVSSERKLQGLPRFHTTKEHLYM